MKSYCLLQGIFSINRYRKRAPQFYKFTASSNNEDKVRKNFFHQKHLHFLVPSLPPPPLPQLTQKLSIHRRVLVCYPPSWKERSRIFNTKRNMRKGILLWFFTLLCVRVLHVLALGDLHKQESRQPKISSYQLVAHKQQGEYLFQFSCLVLFFGVDKSCIDR